MQPKKTKTRKAHKGRVRGTATSGAKRGSASYSLKAMAPGKQHQIEAARRALTRHMKRAGRVRLVFPDVPVSKNQAESPHWARERRIVGGAG